MKWHDGRSVTIEDVQFTFDYLLKWKPPLWQPFMEVIAGSERLGDRSVRVKLKSPAATFMTISMAQITLLPKHIWERVPEQVGVSSPLEWDPTRNDGMIGSGPFKFSRFEKTWTATSPPSANIGPAAQARRHPLHPGRQHRTDGGRHGSRPDSYDR